MGKSCRKSSAEIDQVLRSKSLPALRQLLLSDRPPALNRTQRKQCWLALLHVPYYTGAGGNKRRSKRKPSVSELPDPTEFIDSQNPYYRQIKLDIDRTAFPYPQLHATKDAQAVDESQQHQQSEIANEWQRKHRRQLFNVLQALFSRNRNLHYYQGFHDIVRHLLLCLQCECQTFLCAERLALFYQRDAMFTGSLEPVMSQLSLIFELIEWRDKELHRELVEERQLQPFFAVSWLLTWFSHNLSSSNDTAGVLDRLFDVFLAGGPLLPICISAALLLAHSEEIRAFPGDASELHGYLQALPATLLKPIAGGDAANGHDGTVLESAGRTTSLDDLINFAVDLAQSIPQERLSKTLKDEYSACLRFQQDIGDLPWGMLSLLPPSDLQQPRRSSLTIVRRRRRRSGASETVQDAMTRQWWDTDLENIQQILSQQSTNWQQSVAERKPTAVAARKQRWLLDKQLLTITATAAIVATGASALAAYYLYLQQLTDSGGSDYGGFWPSETTASASPWSAASFLINSINQWLDI